MVFHSATGHASPWRTEVLESEVVTADQAWNELDLTIFVRLIR